MTTATTAKALSFADERAIRDHYQRMLDSREHGAEAYAECFTPDAVYIIANGKVQRGWQEIVDGHKIIFSAWARNSRSRAGSTASPSSPPTWRSWSPMATSSTRTTALATRTSAPSTPSPPDATQTGGRSCPDQNTPLGAH